MTLHLGFEIPKEENRELDSASVFLTSEELKIIKTQIRKNSYLIEGYIQRLDLIVNKEKHPQAEYFIIEMRKKLNLLIEENNTFRKVYWNYLQSHSSNPTTS